MVVDLLALAASLAMMQATLDPADPTPSAKHRATIVTGYPTHQKIVISLQDLHNDGQVWFGAIFNIRFSDLRSLDRRKWPFHRDAPIQVTMMDPPETTTHMILLVDMDYSHPVAREWAFTHNGKNTCISGEVLESYTIEEPIRGMIRNADGDLCLKR